MDTVTETLAEAQPALVPDLTAVLPQSLLEPEIIARRSRLRTLSSPIMALVEFCKGVASPGLNGVPPISTLHIRDGGQHRF